MWKYINGRLVHVVDKSRVRFKTYISKQQLQELEVLSEDKDTHISYLLENGLENLIKDENFVFNKKNRLRDKVEFRTTCNKDVLKQARDLAKEQKLNFTDIIQASVAYIKVSEVKNKSWRHRTE